MHICFLAIDYHESSAGGGIASYVNTIGPELVARGHQVTVLAKGRQKQVITQGQMRIVRTPLGNLHWYLYKSGMSSSAVMPVREVEWSLGLSRELKQLVTEEKIDVVETSETGILFLGNRHKRFPPFVARLHGERYVFDKYSGQKIGLGVRLNRRIVLHALRRASAISSPSRFQANEVTNALGCDPHHIQVIYNPVSPLLLQATAKYDSLDSERQDSTVLYTGRIGLVKGTVPLLGSVTQVAREVPEVQYIIAGARHSSIDDDTLNEMLIRDNVQQHVKLLGHLPWHQLVDLYRRASIFVMPSYYETFGISVVEAMAFGLPVVATTAGGLPEVVENGVTGILVPPGDPKALADAIICLLRNPELRQRMGQAGRERVQTEFTVERVVEQTQAVYQEVAKQT
jgi:glycogen(starch) synthase